MRRYFVQFPHPGAEGGLDRCDWARGKQGHVRKFMAADGLYRRSLDRPDQPGEISFWTEWEAASEAAPIEYREGRRAGAPHFLHRPTSPRRDQRPAGIPQNTDPFVFGDRFLYTFCAQPRTSAKRIHELAPGSVLVFGSVKRGSFVLDTVLVVAESWRHTVDDWRSVTADRVPDAFVLTTLEPMYAWPGSRRRGFTLYRGATSREPVHGMYSFVPCRPTDDLELGFPRPALDGVSGINPRNARAIKFNRDIAENRVPALWEAVVARVVESGLALGTRVDPPR